MVSDNPESFADLDGHDEIKNTGVCEGDKVCSGEGPDLLIEAGEFLRNVTDEDSNGQTEPAAEQKADDEAAAAKESAAATAPAADQAIEKVSQKEADRVAEPLIESASEKAAPDIGAVVAPVLKWVGVVAAAVADMTVLAPSAGRSSEDAMLREAQSRALPDAQNSSRRHTRNKHTKAHPSRTKDKLRKRDSWEDKKFGGKRNRKRNNDYSDQN